MNDDGTQSIQVNFGKPFPLFPLDGVVLLPHALLRLFIFEPRYRQMIEDALDGPRQIAMAVFEGDRWRQEYHGNPPVRRSVCIGQIIQHQALPDGNYRIGLQGVCRAQIREEIAPDGERLYRAAMLEPTETVEPSEDELFLVRDGVLTRLGSEPLSELTTVRAVGQQLAAREISTPALLEVVTLNVLNDKSLQYRLLAEGDVVRRGEIIERELRRLGRVLESARKQFDPDAPPGVSWN
jgi:Lon protease-like protein